MDRYLCMVPLSIAATLLMSGSSDGSTSTTPAWTGQSGQNAGYGLAVSTAGDVNGDGFADVVVGAHEFNDGVPFQGAAFLHYGSASGLGLTPTILKISQAGSVFGRSVASGGDMNGDGFSDVIVGAPGYDAGENNEGGVFAYLGSATGIAGSSWHLESNQTEALFGGAVAGAGDVNGDGYGDFIVGARMYDNGQADEGRVFVYLGSVTGPGSVWTAESDQAGAMFGNSVAAAGDVNGDGFCDVIIGSSDYAHGQQQEGRAFCYLGSASGLAIAPTWTAESDQVQAFFGWSVSGAGDVDNDGFDDVLVGAVSFNGCGRCFAYSGSAAGLTAAPTWTYSGISQNTSALGAVVAAAGDTNGDGFADVLVTAPTFDNGQNNEGEAWIFNGTSAGLATLPAWTAQVDQGSAFFGNAASPAGDVDGDGFADVIIGADGFDFGPQNEGGAFLYLGGCDAVASATAYGAGKSGTNGVPVLSSLVAPILGHTTDITLTGALPGASPVFLFAGFAPASIPFDAGTLLVVPFTTVILPPIGVGGAFSLPVPLPGNGALCGLQVYFQAGFVDPGAVGPYHTALTPGLRWVLGS